MKSRLDANIFVASSKQRSHHILPSFELQHNTQNNNQTWTSLRNASTLHNVGLWRGVLQASDNSACWVCQLFQMCNGRSFWWGLPALSTNHNAQHNAKCRGFPSRIAFKSRDATTGKHQVAKRQDLRALICMCKKRLLGGSFNKVILLFFQKHVVAALVIVIPLSCSSSIQSRAVVPSSTLPSL